MTTAAVRELAAEFWEARLRSEPILATFVGDHRFDDEIGDLSAEAEAERRSVWTEMAQRAEAIDRGRLDAADRITLGLLRHELNEAMTIIDLRLMEMAWDQMEGVHSALLTVAPQVNAPTPESAVALVERHRKMGAYLDQALERFRQGLAAGRTPPLIVVERSLRQLDRYLSSPIDGDAFVTFAGPDGWDGEAAWRDELTAVAQEVIRPAFGRYREFVAEHLLPVARPDDRAGLQWLPDGAEMYAGLVRIHTSLALEPETIHAFGMGEVSQRLPVEYAAVGGRLFGLGEAAAIFERLRSDPALRYATGDEILADSIRGVEAATAAMGDWFGRLPAAPCEVKAVPDHLAADTPGAYYFPPSGDGSRPGTYFVNTSEPEDKNRFETAAVAYHEAIPGHHLQLAIATELTLPEFQKHAPGHAAYCEGWGLYAERLADEMGLYPTDLDRLGMLVGDSFRSGRLVVDTGMHALGWSRRRAIDFMVAHTPVSEPEVTVEIDRYLAMPGQALAYKIGQREIFRLRHHAEQTLGDRFDLKAFHDTVLGSASVSLPILQELVEDWISSRAA